MTQIFAGPIPVGIGRAICARCLAKLAETNMRPRSLGLASALTPVLAAVVAADCTEIDGTYTINSNPGASLTVPVLAGDQIVATSASNVTGQVTGSGINIAYAASNVNVISDIATSNGNVVVTYGRLLNGSAGSITLSCVPAASGGTGGTGGAGGSVTGTGGSTASGTAETEAFLMQAGQRIGAANQAGTVAGAIRNALSSVDTGGGNQFFFVTPDNSSGSSAWASLSGSNFSGSVSGDGFALNLGIQRQFTPDLMAGFAVSLTDIGLETATDRLEVDAVMFGPYVGFSSGSLDVDGYVLFGNTDYTLNGATADGDRLVYGVRASAPIRVGNTTISPHVSVSGFRDNIGILGTNPATEVEQTTLGLGARFDFELGSDWRPYASVGVDAYRFQDGVTTSKEITPRLGAGFEWEVGGGSVSLDLAGSEVGQDLRQVALSLNYGFSF